MRLSIQCVVRARGKRSLGATTACFAHRLSFAAKKRSGASSTTKKHSRPAWGRKFEPPSLCTSESVGIVRYLMGEENPTPEIREAVDAAAAWLRAARIDGLRVTRSPRQGTKGKGVTVTASDPTAPPVWARMYEIGTDRPIFCGRDSVIKYRVADIEAERSSGYAWYGSWPQALLEKEYPAWKAQQKDR